MNTQQIAQLAQTAVNAVKGVITQSKYSPEKYKAVSTSASSLLSSMDKYDDLVAKFQDPNVSAADKQKLAKTFMADINVQSSAAHVAIGTLMTQSTEMYKSLVNGAEIGQIFGENELPSLQCTTEQIQWLLELPTTHGAAVVVDGTKITITLHNVKTERFGNIRKTWKRIQMVFDLARGNWKEAIGMYAPDDNPTKSINGHGHSMQKHPHILSSNRPCLQGDSAWMVGGGWMEGRYYDVFATLYHLMIEPYESPDHTTDIVGMADAEMKCDKCGEWGHWKDKSTGQWAFKTDDTTGLITESHFTCTKCIGECPVTGLPLLPGQTAVHKGITYHYTALGEYKDKAYLLSEMTKLGGELVPNELLETCFVTGIRGLPKAYPHTLEQRRATTNEPLCVLSPETLVKLPCGKAVAAFCLDVINPDGTHVKEQDRSTLPCWWQGLISNAWATPGSSWHRLVAERVAQGKQAAAAGAGQ